MRTEAEQTLNDLMRLARQACPLISVWPERIVAMFEVRPPLHGLWRNRATGSNLFGWPIFLYATLPGASWHPVEQVRRVEEFAALNPQFGVAFDFDRVRKMQQLIHGFAVFVPQNEQPPTYQDDQFTRFWYPVVQCWKLAEPLKISELPRGNAGYMKHNDRTNAVKAMSAATRIW